jgi:hypothetical protein
MLIPPVKQLHPLDAPDKLHPDEATPVTVNRGRAIDRKPQAREGFSSFGVLSGSNYEYGQVSFSSFSFSFLFVSDTIPRH